MNPSLSAWLKAATSSEIDAVAQAAGTTRKYLYLLASDKDYGRKASADLAQRIEAAALAVAHMRPSTGEQLPILTREAICPACGRCELARRARAS